MKTILEIKKEIAEMDNVKKIKEYLEENIVDKSVNAEARHLGAK